MESNAIQTLYLTYAHNKEFIGYFVGFCFTLFLTIIKPNRSSLIAAIGLLVLALGFQYDKHILQGLQQQTLDSLFPNGANDMSVQQKITKVFNYIIPFVMWIVG